MNVSTSSKGSVASIKVSDPGASNGNFSSGYKSNGGSHSYQSGQEQQVEEYSGPKLSEVLGQGGASSRARLVIGGKDGEESFNGNLFQSYNPANDSPVEGAQFVSQEGFHITNQADITDDTLVRIGGLEMRVGDAVRNGLLTKGDSQSSDHKQQKEVHQQGLSEEAQSGMELMNSSAGENIDSSVLDACLATLVGDDEGASAVLSSMADQMGSKMSRAEVVGAVQRVLWDTVKTMKGVRPDAVKVATERLGKLIEQGQAGEARSIAQAIMYGDRKALKNLLR